MTKKYKPFKIIIIVIIVSSVLLISLPRLWLYRQITIYEEELNNKFITYEPAQRQRTTRNLWQLKDVQFITTSLEIYKAHHDGRLPSYSELFNSEAEKPTWHYAPTLSGWFL